jgi:hypothetical protein
LIARFATLDAWFLRASHLPWWGRSLLELCGDEPAALAHQRLPVELQPRLERRPFTGDMRRVLAGDLRRCQGMRPASSSRTLITNSFEMPSLLADAVPVAPGQPRADRPFLRRPSGYQHRAIADA